MTNQDKLNDEAVSDEALEMLGVMLADNDEEEVDITALWAALEELEKENED